MAVISDFSAEVAEIDLGLVHVAAPTRASQRRCVNGACVLFGQARVCRLSRTDQLGRIA
jgi:hypothetical protein